MFRRPETHKPYYLVYSDSVTDGMQFLVRKYGTPFFSLSSFYDKSVAKKKIKNNNNNDNNNLTYFSQ